MNIEQAIVDVDTSPGVVAGHLCGCQVRPDEFGSFAAPFADGFDVLPRSEWQEGKPEASFANSNVWRIKNQGREGTCTSNATTQAMEIVANQQFGGDNWVELSPISIYKACGRSASSGSSVSCNIRRATDVGALPVGNDDNWSRMQDGWNLNSSHTMPPRGFHTPYPEGFRDTAKHFRIDETSDIESFDEFATALQRGWPVVYGRAGHAICGVLLVRHRGQWAVRYANSWGNWGDSGYGYDTEGYISRAIRQYGAIAVRSVVIPGFLAG